MTKAQQKKWRPLRTCPARRPLRCTWQVTCRCDFRCSFCHYWCDQMAHLPEQSIEDFTRGARKLARWGALLISLDGGVPDCAAGQAFFNIDSTGDIAVCNKDDYETTIPARY